MGNIESSANPRWDDDWRHKYANGIDQFIRSNAGATAAEPSPDDDDHRDQY